uniref:neurensin-1-like n=1 Tax=Styela clava TaxID=7725 RepID=UPI00193ABCB8|nr:neurensin-1-like [Styela clava]
MTSPASKVGSGGSTSGSIKYSEDSSGSLPHHVSPTSPTRGPTKVKFGVKSYLHHFYEDCAGIGDVDEDAEYDGYQVKPKSLRRWDILSTVGFSVAIILIVAGIVLLLVGFLVPAKRTRFVLGRNTYVKQDNVEFNKFLMYSRWAGAFTFCFGGISLSVCIALIGFGKLNKQSEMAERKIFEDRLQRSTSSKDEQSYQGTDEFGNLVQYGTCGTTTIPTPTLSTSYPVPMSLREVTPVQPNGDDR